MKGSQMIIIDAAIYAAIQGALKSVGGKSLKGPKISYMAHGIKYVAAKVISDAYVKDFIEPLLPSLGGTMIIGKDGIACIVSQTIVLSLYEMFEGKKPFAHFLNSLVSLGLTQAISGKLYDSY